MESTHRPQWMTDFYDRAPQDYEGWIKICQYGAVQEKSGHVSEQVWLGFIDFSGEEWYVAIDEDKTVELNIVHQEESLEYFGTTTFEKLVEHLDLLPVTARKRFRENG